MKLCEMKPEKIYQDRDMVFEVKILSLVMNQTPYFKWYFTMCKKGERIAIVGEMEVANQHF